MFLYVQRERPLSRQLTNPRSDPILEDEAGPWVELRVEYGQLLLSSQMAIELRPPGELIRGPSY